jgi:hypothetical protein
MDLIINEVSLPFLSKDECTNKLNQVFKIIHLADFEGIGFNHAVQPHGNWNTLHYADSFIFSEWINQLDSDNAMLVKNVLSKVDCPLVELVDDSRDALGGLLFSLSYDCNIEVASLGVAANVGSHALSFPSHEQWLHNPIPIIKNWVDNNEWQEELINVPNIYSLEHLKVYIADLTIDRQQKRTYLSTLEIEKNKDFPNLIFCKNALKNFSSSAVTINDFGKIIETLKKLDNAIVCSNNLEALKTHSVLTISGESKPTMDTGKYSRQREFIHPHLGKVMFEQHVKNFEGGKRMHFLADYTGNKISIGYFGNHLPTVKHPT